MVEINPKHPKVDFSKPIQYKARDNGIGGHTWLDCLLSSDGKTLYDGVNGAGNKMSLEWNELRNTPSITTEEIVVIRDNAIDLANSKYKEALRNNTKRLAAMQYKEKTLP